MAYNVYIACDICGRDMHLSCNRTFSMTHAIKKAIKNGWKVKKIKNHIERTDFICPDCRQSAERAGTCCTDSTDRWIRFMEMRKLQSSVIQMHTSKVLRDVRKAGEVE